MLNGVCFQVYKYKTVALLHVFQSKKNYEKRFQDQERAMDTFKKADADINLSRAEVEKVEVDKILYWHIQ